MVRFINPQIFSISIAKLDFKKKNFNHKALKDE